MDSVVGWVNDHAYEDVCINVVSRDLGYGSEMFSREGYFTGQVDTWGKLTFHDAYSDETFYLFPDEVEIC